MSDELPPRQTVISVRQLRRVFKSRQSTVEAVAGIDLEVYAGEIFGFLGPNGAGKTTTLRAIMGILRPLRGEIRWDGRPATAADRSHFGYMPEERGLYPRMRLFDQLQYFARLHGLSAVEAGQ